MCFKFNSTDLRGLVTLELYKETEAEQTTQLFSHTAKKLLVYDRKKIIYLLYGLFARNQLFNISIEDI